MQPIIGITTFAGKNPEGLPYVTLLQAYVDAIMGAGGVPLLIPNMLAEDGWDILYGRLDGVLFSGGGDFDPKHFGGKDHPRIDGVDPMRDAVELNLVRAVVDDGKPFLGICRGIQAINIGLGGTIYEHLGDQYQEGIDHTYPSNMRTALVHEVKVEEGTRLADVVGEPILKVNSLHHQGLKEVASELRITGRSSDGLVEAVELPEHPFGLAVQWHPEMLTDQLPTRKLFRAFVEAAESK